MNKLNGQAIFDLLKIYYNGSGRIVFKLTCVRFTIRIVCLYSNVCAQLIFLSTNSIIFGLVFVSLFFLSAAHRKSNKKFTLFNNKIFWGSISTDSKNFGFVEIFLSIHVIWIFELIFLFRYLHSSIFRMVMDVYSVLTRKYNFFSFLNNKSKSTDSTQEK